MSEALKLRNFYETSGAATPVVVNKFGRAPDGIQNTLTDVWDLADGGVGQQQIWVRPTVKRIHQIESSDVNDAAAGTGARTLRVYGISDWDSAEISEDITLNGTTKVPTTEPFAVIHRMKCLTAGSGEVNAGIIKATADTDGTITARINAGEGQTQMAIYGIPSNRAAYVHQYYVSMNRSGNNRTADAFLKVLVNPDGAEPVWLTKHTIGMQAVGSSYFRHEFLPEFRITGPAIIKVSVIASANDTECSAGFDLTMLPG